MRGLLFVLSGGAFAMVLGGELSLARFLGGCLLAFGVGALAVEPGRRLTPRRLLRALVALPQILGWFFVELLASNWQQLRLVFLRPVDHLCPRWISFETRLESPSLRAVLGIMISMTPGTITTEIEGKRIYIHAIDAVDADAELRTIRRRLETPLVGLEKP